jgi:hypothetical protein
MATKTEKQAPKGDALAKAVKEMAETQPAAVDPAASRMQVPPGQSSAGADEYKVKEVIQDAPIQDPQRPTITAPDIQPAVNDPHLSRNQQPPPGITAQVQAGPVEPTEQQIFDFLAKRYPGVTLENIKSAQAMVTQTSGHPAETDLAGLERHYGPGYITAHKKGDPEVRYFTALGWKNLGGNNNIEGWRQDVVIPPEVLNLNKK